jgi:1,4-dihydroxy-2-naphthoyl-CoA hydrolase
MTIWFRDYNLEDLASLTRDNLLECLGIEFTGLGDDYLEGRMPVDKRTRQPIGLLHGGASVALAETLGSTAANLTVDPARYYCVGLDINANHIRSVTSGFVTGIARLFHRGRTTQVWDIRINDGRDRLVCVSRLTLSVLPLSRVPGGTRKNPD